MNKRISLIIVLILILALIVVILRVNVKNINNMNSVNAKVELKHLVQRLISFREENYLKKKQIVFLLQIVT